MTFYRFEDTSGKFVVALNHLASVDDDRIFIPDSSPLESTFSLIKETPCGYWIDVYGAKKWVSKNGKKRYAYPTRELAWESYRKRKEKQVSILSCRLAVAKAFLAEAKKELPTEKKTWLTGQ